MNLKLAVLPVVALFGLASCSDDIDVIDAGDGVTVELVADLSSSNTTLRRVNTGDTTVYGWNLLEGEAELDGRPVAVEMLGNVDYVEGNGDFFGFVTFTFEDGSTIGTRMVGEAVAASDTSNATFTSTLTVIGGTGAYLDVSGTGTFEGERIDTLGGVVSSDFVLDLVVAGAD